MNYEQNITFYQFFSIKVVVIQQKLSCLQIVSIVYWQYILILLIMRRLHLLSLYVGHVCIIKRPRSFTVLKISVVLISASALIPLKKVTHYNKYTYSNTDYYLSTYFVLRFIQNSSCWDTLWTLHVFRSAINTPTLKAHSFGSSFNFFICRFLKSM